MADNTKDKILFGNASTADVYLALRLDADLYDADTCTLVGATRTNTGNKPEIPISKRYAIASGLVQEKGPVNMFEVRRTKTSKTSFVSAKSIV